MIFAKRKGNLVRDRCGLGLRGASSRPSYESVGKKSGFDAFCSLIRAEMLFQIFKF